MASSTKPTSVHGPISSLGNLVIRASAGTGKTYRLTNRFLGLLARGELRSDLSDDLYAQGSRRDF